MNKMLLVAWIFALPCLVSSGQTNCAKVAIKPPPAPQAHWFPPPDPQLLKLPAQSEDVSRPASHETFAFSSHPGLYGDPSEAVLMRRLEEQGFFERTAPTYNNDLQRKIAEAFRPQTIKVGHVRIRSTIVDAIARKNPLCLLNPNILDVSF